MVVFSGAIGALYRPSPDEQIAIDTLGFRFPADGLPHAEEVTLGTVERRNHDYPDEGPMRVTVAVQAWPARFWRFTLEKPRMQPVVIRTGSGSFEEYWHRFAEPFFDGMYSIEVAGK